MEETLRIGCFIDSAETMRDEQQINVSSESVDYSSRKDLLDAAAALDKEDAFGRLVLPRDSYKKRLYRIPQTSDILKFYREQNAEFREIAGEAYDEIAAHLEKGELAVGLDYNPDVHFDGHVIFDHQWDTVQRFFKHFRGVGVVADQVGMGKTIEAGMIMSELAERGLIKSVLIVASSAASLSAWQQEMLFKFGALFPKATQWEQLFGSKRLSKAIMLQDTFAQKVCDKYISDYNRHRGDSYAAKSYDLIIIDESHKLNSDVLCGRRIFQCLDYMMDAKWKRGKPYCVLISGTPHKADMMSLYPLMKIVRRDLFNAKGADRERINQETYVRYCYGAKSLPELLNLDDAGGYDSAEARNRGRTRYADFINRFMIRHTRRQLEADVAKTAHKAADKVFKDKNSESFYFFPVSDQAVAQEVNEAPLKCKSKAEAGKKQYEILNKAGVFDDDDTLESDNHGIIRQYYHANPNAVTGVTSIFTDCEGKCDHVCAYFVPRKKGAERDRLKNRAYFDARFEKLAEILDEHKNERVIVFFESVAGNSRGWKEREELAVRLPERCKRPVINATDKTGHDIVDVFAKKENDNAVLLANSVCDQSVNLQFCHIIVNFSISKSPMVMDQRVGRIDRIGQKDNMRIYSFADVSMLDGYLLRFYNENLDLFSKWNGDIIMATACDDSNTTIYKCDKCGLKRRANTNDLDLEGKECKCGGKFHEIDKIFVDARNSGEWCGNTKEFFEFTPATLECRWESGRTGVLKETEPNRFVCSDECPYLGDGCSFFRRGEQNLCKWYPLDYSQDINPTLKVKKEPNSCRGCLKLACWVDVDLNKQDEGLLCPKCTHIAYRRGGTGNRNSLEVKSNSEAKNDFESYVKQLWGEKYFYDNFSAEVDNIYNIVCILGNAEE